MLHGRDQRLGVVDADRSTPIDPFRSIHSSPWGPHEAGAVERGCPGGGRAISPGGGRGNEAKRSGDREVTVPPVRNCSVRSCGRQTPDPRGWRPSAGRRDR
jgi:hypothetical protein